MLQQLDTAKDGLTADDAKQRLTRYDSNLLKPPKRSDLVTLLLVQFKSPITLILLCATGLSFALRDPVDAFIPLGPYILLPKASTALVASVAITWLALAAFGYVKGHVTGAAPVRSAFQAVHIGGVAAGAALLIARAIS
jgi:VIT1/CCC1 family predicted Fe2+/Mn2+ transporter